MKKNITDKEKLTQVQYRPFDLRYTYYTGNSNGFMGRPRKELIKHLHEKENLCLTTIKNSRSNLEWNFLLISKFLCTKPTTITSLDANYTFPLYLYPDREGQHTTDNNNYRIPNLNLESVKLFSESLDLIFTNEKETTKGTFAPIDIFDYIYGVLHSPHYREKYNEFLKIDFPRVPYPKDQNTFWKLVKLGGEIRQIHLLESPVVNKPISKYSITGTNIVGKVKYEDGKVFINDTQYFEDVPEVSWNFYIGGYQPAQKWLKDRKDRELQVEDIRHYLKIIVALSETDRLMKEIDSIEIE
jgi:predicted helicase